MTYPTSRTGVTCLVPAPRRVTSWFLPFKPFQMTLWLGIFFCLTLEILGLLLTRKLGREENRECSWLDSLRFGYISTLKLFISQGTDFAVRTVLFSCYMIDIIISSIYSGGLASILTIPSLGEAADTVDRLIKQNLIRAGITPDWIFTLQNSQDEKLLTLLSLFRLYSPEEIEEKSVTENIGIPFERLQFGHLALPTYIKQPAIDRLKMMLEDIFYEHCVAYTAWAWPLVQKFNHLSQMVQSSGIMEFWEFEASSKYLNGKHQKQVKASVHPSFESNGPVPLGMENFAGIVVLWIGGNILGALAFVGEVLSRRWTVVGRAFIETIDAMYS